MHQRWHDLLFAHWPVRESELRPLIPSHLELDRFDQQCWVGVVPFWMSNVRPRGFPPLPGLSTFLELNVRTYVIHRGKPGVYFFSLDASNKTAVAIARRWFHLPYQHAIMETTGSAYPKSLPIDHEIPYNTIHYTSRRIQPHSEPAELQMSYRPTAPQSSSGNDPLAQWLTARFCLYTCSPNGTLFCGEIHHEPWPLQNAEAEIRKNTMTSAAGISLPDVVPVLHFSRQIDVNIWPLKQCHL